MTTQDVLQEIQAVAEPNPGKLLLTLWRLGVRVTTWLEPGPEMDTYHFEVDTGCTADPPLLIALGPAPALKEGPTQLLVAAPA